MREVSLYVRAIYQLARPKTLILIWLQYALIVVFLGGPSVISLCLNLAIIAAWYIHAVAVNDLSDQEVDAINLPSLGEDKDRPLVNKTLTAKRLKQIIIGVMAVVIVLSLYLHWLLVPVSLLLLALNYAYSRPPLHISYRGGLAQLLLPLGYVIFPAIIAIASSPQSISSPLVLLIVGLHILFSGRLLLKDIRDERGDAMVGKRTFLVRHGSKLTLILSGIFMTAGMIVIYIALGMLSRFYVVLGLMLLLSIIGLAVALTACFKAKRLEYKLLFVAFVGRIASSWVFYGLLVGALRFVAVSLSPEMLLGGAALLFCFGCLMLFEELQSVKRRFSTLEF